MQLLRPRPIKGVNLMNNQERIKKYKQEYCSKCKNKETQDCSIRVFIIEKTIYTKCDYYEREDKL